MFCVHVAIISNKVREEGFQLQLKLTQEIEELRKQTESIAAEAERQATVNYFSITYL